MKKFTLSVIVATSFLLSAASSFAGLRCAGGDYIVSIADSEEEGTLSILVGGDAWSSMGLRFRESQKIGTMPTITTYGSGSNFSDDLYRVKTTGPGCFGGGTHVNIYKVKKSGKLKLLKSDIECHQERGPDWCGTVPGPRR